MEVSFGLNFFTERTRRTVSRNVAFTEEQSEGMQLIMSNSEVVLRTELESIDYALGILGAAIVVSILSASVYLSLRYLL